VSTPVRSGSLQQQQAVSAGLAPSLFSIGTKSASTTRQTEPDFTLSMAGIAARSCELYRPRECANVRLYRH
jgi:hypothetical protein